MDPKELKRQSKFLSMILRHRPEVLGLELEEGGWISVDLILSKMNAAGRHINLDLLEEIVRQNNKQRFAFSENKEKIRANQGHSVEINLGYKPTPPPENLFHGTAIRNLDSILQNGLLKGQRHHVHLSIDMETAVNVGSRHGKPIVLTVLSQKMHTEGYEFYISENGVWLTDSVPSEYIKFPTISQ